MGNVAETKINPEVLEKEIQDLEKEMNESEWSRGWEKGWNDAIASVKKNLLPPDDRILKSAEIIVRLLESRYGKMFDHVFAGFNCYYDEPAVLVSMKKDSACRRSELIRFGIELQSLFADSELLPINILATKTESADFGSIRKDFGYERK